MIASHFTIDPGSLVLLLSAVAFALRVLAGVAWRRRRGPR